jgi:HEAT repeat protein/energy-coupling factor transporter ATP-binding protein EcfA2
VVDAFLASRRRLLLLGQPGSGKTTALVHLAGYLLSQADASPDAPVPFVLNLSKFRLGSPERTIRILARNSPAPSDPTRDTRFEDWVVAEIAAFPGLSPQTARQWIQQGSVAVLFDGLDEFNDDHRAGLVRLLNTTFLHDHPGLSVVVCSRTNEYEVLRSVQETRLQLSGCVQLQPLTDEQVADYLKARNAAALLSALPTDAALQELARTPLTLSMLVGAYGGSAPPDLSAPGTLSERRHRLFQSYVARMLQRQARKEKLGIPFDDSHANDVPESDYRYRADRVHRWLGWLALTLSVRMRTSFTVDGFYGILSAGAKADRQPLDLCAVYFALGSLLSFSLAAVALTIFPFTWNSWGSALAIAAAAWVILPLCKATLERWHLGENLGLILLAATLSYDVAVLAHVLSAVLPFRISSMPMSVILAGVLAAVFSWLAFAAKPRDEVPLRIAISSSAGIILSFVLRLLPLGSHLKFLGSDWSQMAIVATAVSVGAASTESGFASRLGLGGAFAAVGAILVAFTWAVGAPNPAKTLAAAAASSLLILIAAQIPLGLALQSGFVVLLLAGGILARHTGPLLAGGLFALLFVSAAVFSDHPSFEVTPGRLGRSLVAWQFNALQKTVLSPILWWSVALAGRLPWRRRPFLAFCRDAFLPKQAGAELEFVHRLLRDYFALHQLLPAVAAADRATRLGAIRSLGYQGESALDLLEELSQSPEPDIRAAAVTGLGHISSPIVASILERTLSDRARAVRLALIPAIFRLSDETLGRLLNELVPLGDGSEVAALLACAGDYTTRRVQEALVRLGAPAVMPLIARLGERDPNTLKIVVQALGEIKDSRALDPLLGLYAREKAAQVRASILGALAGQADPRAQDLLLRALHDKDPRLRIAAIETLGRLRDPGALNRLLPLLEAGPRRQRLAVIAAVGQIGDQRAVPALARHLDDREEEVSVKAAGALDDLGDPRGRSSLKNFLNDASVTKRRWSVGQLARNRDLVDQVLLGSLGSDWLDPREPVSSAALAARLDRYGAFFTREEALRRFRQMKDEFNLTLEF